MKYLSSFAMAALLSATNISTANAQGWPSNYNGVMLQGFYWDSYKDSQWTTLEKQSDELSKYFSLIWVPQSGKASASKSMGYDPKYYFDQNSAFGTEAQLRSMIKTFKNAGLGTIADVVINHRANVSSWVDFPAETYNGVTYEMVATDICKNDDGGATQKNNPSVTLSSNNDEGEDWSGMRDLDHKSANVQKCVKAYEDFLLNDLGYTGFRYDMVKGFAASHIADYNSTAGVKYSVGENWSDNSTIKTWIDGTKLNSVPQSAAFDFQFRYQVRDAINNNDWAKVSGSNCLVYDKNYRRYAVTFVENHDTEKRADAAQDPIKKDTLAANACLLAMPGTPCVFFKHWQAYKKEIKLMIEARKLAGINNESTYSTFSSSASCTAICVTGSKCELIFAVGPKAAEYTRDGWKELISGYHYKYLVPSTTDTSGWAAIEKQIEEETVEPEQETVTIPDCCVVNDGETCAFFENNASWTNTIKAWVWNDATGYTNYTGGTWPGEACTKVGQASNGNDVWKWTCSVAFTASKPMIIFSSNGSPQTDDFTFKNGGYYTYEGLQGTVSTTGIDDVTIDEKQNGNSFTYNLQGIRVGGDYKGIVIRNGKKYNNK